MSLIEGVLGKDHPATLRTRGIRSSLSNPAARHPHAATATPAT
ncbi:MAG: hypothetical protein ABIT76_03365 [Chthoniobacterales bacterium]